MGQRGKIEVMLRVFGDIPKHRLTPNLDTYVALINAFQRHKNMEDCLKYFEMLKTNGLTPDIEFYHDLIAYSQKSLHRFNFSEMWISKLEEQGIEPDLPLVNLLMQVYGTHNKLEMMLKTFLRLKDIGLPNPQTLSILWKFLPPSVNDKLSEKLRLLKDKKWKVDDSEMKEILDLIFSPKNQILDVTHKQRVLRLYRNIIKNGLKMPTQNRRDWIRHKARVEFVENKDLDDATDIDFFVRLAETQLENIQIQAKHLSTTMEMEKNEKFTNFWARSSVYPRK